MKLIFSVAMQGIRGARWDFFFFSWAVFLSVVSVTGLLSTAQALRTWVDLDARRMLAADLRLESSTPFDDVVAAQLHQPGWVVAENLEFTAMVRLPGSAETVLVDVLAAAPEYPLRGGVELRSSRSLNRALAGEGAVVEAALKSRLALPLGGHFYLGEARFELSDILQNEPDRLSRLFRWGPRLIIPKSRVAATGLVRVGSRIQYVALVGLPEGENPLVVANQLQHQLAGRAIQVVTPTQSNRSARRFIHRFTLFLGILTLLTLLSTGNAMAGSMAAHVGENRAQIAILKALGATHGQVMGLFLWRVVLMALPGSLLGALAGQMAPLLLTGSQEVSVSIPFISMFSLPIFLLGLAVGLGGGLLFSIGALWGVRSVGVGTLFRAVEWGGGMDFLHWKWRWGVPLAVMMGCAGVIGQHNDWRIALLFLGELGLILWILWLVAKGSLWLLQRIHPTNLIVRLAIRGVVVPGRGALGAIVSVGLGLAVLCTILLLEQNLDQQMVSNLPHRAPSFFLLDLQSDQVAPLQALASRFVSTPEDLRLTPVIRGRISALKGVRVTPEWVAAHPESWRFSRDYVLTWAAELPVGNRLTAGRWWSDDSTPEVSLEQKMAQKLGLKLGDMITFDILGVATSARITSLRAVRWSDLGLNFFVVFSPVVLQGAPFAYLGSVALEPTQEESFRDAVVGSFHNVSVIAVREVMALIAALLTKLLDSVRVAAGMAGVAGLIALGVSLMLTRRARVREVAIHRLLGATRREMLWVALVEYLLLGLMAVVGAIIVGELVTAGVTLVLFDDLWEWLPNLIAWFLVVGVGVVVLIGLLVARWDLQGGVMGVLWGHD